MTASSLEPLWLKHPCDTAFGALLSPTASRTVLYLMHVGSPTNDSYANSSPNAFRVALTDTPDTAGAVQKRLSFALDSPRQLPAHDEGIDLVVLSSCVPISQWARLFTTLLRDIRRVLKPTGELLLVYEPGDGNRRVKQNLMRRLRDRVYMLRNALFHTDRRSVLEALERSGLTYSDWFAPWRDQSGCLATIQPIETRLLPARHWKQQLKVIAAKEMVVRAATSPLQPSFLIRCALEAANSIDSDSHSPTTSRVNALLVTPKEKVVAIANVNGSDIVLRIPLSDRALHACQQNMLALKSLQADSHCAALAPYPLHESSLCGQYFSAESRVEGTPLVKLPPLERRLELVETLIKTLNPTSRLTQRKLESTTYDELVGAPLSNILPRITRAEDRAVLARYFAAAVQGMPYAAGVSHGDFSLGNIFTQDDKISGVIDWDEGAMNGLPVLDAISHLCSRQGHRSGRFSDTLCRLATRQWPESAELAFLDRCYAYFGVEPGQHFALVMLYWLQIVGSQSQFWFSQGTDFNRSHIDDIVYLISHRSDVA